MTTFCLSIIAQEYFPNTFSYRIHVDIEHNNLLCAMFASQAKTCVLNPLLVYWSVSSSRSLRPDLVLALCGQKGYKTYYRHVVVCSSCKVTVILANKMTKAFNNTSD